MTHTAGSPDWAYKTLGLPTGASRWKLKMRRRQLVREWHPDRFAQAPLEDRLLANERMKEINAAFAYLQSAPVTRPTPSPGQPRATDEAPAKGHTSEGLSDTWADWILRFGIGSILGAFLMLAALADSALAWWIVPPASGLAAVFFKDPFFSIARRVVMWW